MECKPDDIIRLVEAAVAHAGYKPLHAQFPLVHERMKEHFGKRRIFAENYLYKKMYLRARKAKKLGEKTIKLSDEWLDVVSVYLEYKTYYDFLERENYPLSDGLKKCEGEWYSYVRCNSGEPDVLISPVRVQQKSRQMMVEMKGATRTFEGELKEKGSCLFCLLESGQEKSIHLVLKLGLAKNPEVLQGVFSGLSSGGDPIAGREVWIRQAGVEFENRKHRKKPIAELLASAEEEEKAIGAYFNNKEKNILKGGQASSFGLGDLKQK